MVKDVKYHALRQGTRRSDSSLFLSRTALGIPVSEISVRTRIQFAKEAEPSTLTDDKTVCIEIP